MQVKGRFGIQVALVLPAAALCLLIAACGGPGRSTRRTETYLGPDPPRPNNAFHETSLPALRAEIPTIAEAEFVDDDELCLTCHKVYTETHRAGLAQPAVGRSTAGKICERREAEPHKRGEQTDLAENVHRRIFKWFPKLASRWR